MVENILQDIQTKRSINADLIENEFHGEYEEKRYYIQKIIDKYYAPAEEPLNDNTELIAQLKKNFMKTNIIEKIANLFRTKKVEKLPEGKYKEENAEFVKQIRYEGTIKTPTIEVEPERNQVEIQMNYEEKE